MIVESSDVVTLVGGGALPARDMALARARSRLLVAVDGGANRLAALGILPAALIGDMDSVRPGVLASYPRGIVHEIAEQDSTDFEKALRSVRAPVVLAVGFQGARLDHTLAVLTALVTHRAQPCIVIGASDIIFHAPLRLELSLVPGDRLSLFPMAPVTGRDTGLRWPIEGIAFAPDGRIGTSNAVVSRAVALVFDGPGMLVILPRKRLDAAIAALSGRSRSAPSPSAVRAR